MAGQQGIVIVSDDTVIKGDIRNCKQIEIYGYVEGGVAASSFVVHEGGKFFGQARAEIADVRGTVQGDVAIKNLINIRSSGTVSGNVQYGRLAVEVGGSLSADVRNVPPELFGDFELTVEKGKAARITTSDITAVDPDDTSAALKFEISKATGGFVAFSAAPGLPISNFTQADLEAGAVLFVHDGSSAARAGFDVIVRDAEGATSGPARRVNVAVR